METAIEQDVKARKQHMMKLFCTAPKQFVEWAAQYVYSQVETYGYAAPWNNKVASTVTVNKSKPNGHGATATVMDATPTLASKVKKWVKLADAPDVKKKSLNPLGMKLTKGSIVKYKKLSFGAATVGVVDGCTKLNVKIKPEGGTAIIAVPYSQVTEVGLTK